MRRIFIALILLAAAWNSGKAQNCFCDNCPVPIADTDTTFFTIDIVGAANNDLSDPAQGVCGLCLNFEHQYLGDLLIQLVSPAGQVVTLVGPVDLASGFTSFTEWDVCFVACGDVPQPDPGFSPVWDNDQPWGFFGNYSGSYFPYQGCLEDFNTGPVDGSWTLMIIDDIAMSTGEFLDYSITFCDDTNLECVTCNASAGQLNAGPFVSCQGDSSWLLPLVPSFSGPSSPADSTLYNYVWLISQNDTLVEIQQEPDLMAFPPGNYEVCGLSYLLEDSLALPPADGSVLVSELRDILVMASPPFCGRITPQCVQATILSDPIPLDRTDTLCLGDTLFLGADTLTSSGFFNVLVSVPDACDTLYSVDLIVLPVKDTALFHSICEGDFFVLGQDTLTASGLYSAVFTASTGCDSAVTLELEVLNPQAVILPPDTLDCLQTEVILDGTASSSAGAFSSQWYSGLGDSLLTTDSLLLAVETGGTYSLLLTATGQYDPVTCVDTAVIQVFEDTLRPAAGILGDSLLTCAQPEALLLADTSLVDSILLYEWESPDGVFTQASELLVSDSGTYILRVTDPGNGCIALDTRHIGLDTLRPSLTLSGDTLNCVDTLALLTAQSNAPNPQFLWQGPGGFTADTDSVLADIPGMYYLEVTASNGCVRSDSFLLVEDVLPPDFSVQGDSLLTCADSLLLLQAAPSSPALSYLWTYPSGLTLAGDSLPVSSPGIYFVEAKGANGCTRSDTILISIDTLPPQTSVFADTLSCNSPSGQLSVQPQSAGWIYAWQGPGGFTDSLASPIVSLPGAYSLALTAENGCTAFFSTEVLADTLAPDAPISGADTLDCLTTEILLEWDGTGSGTLAFFWENASGDTLAMASSLTVDQAGTYFLTVVNPENGCVGTDSALIFQDTLPPVADAGPDQLLTCTDPSAMLDGTGSTGTQLAYLWIDPLGDVLDSVPVTSGTVAGQYLLVLTSAQNGCTDTDTVLLEADADLPVALIQTPGLIDCVSDSVLLDGSASSSGPAFQYSWLGPDSTLLDTLPTISVGEPGPYVLLVENELNGCTAFDEVTVMANLQQPPVQINATDSILNCAQASLTLTADFPAGPSYLLSWKEASGGFLGQEDSLLVNDPGLYVAEVINLINGCIGTDTILIEENILKPQAIIQNTDTLNCIIGEVVLDGSASLPAGSLVFEWLDPAGSLAGGDSVLVTSSPGIYSLVVLDTTNFCRDTAQLTVVQDTQAVDAQILLPEELNCEADSVLLSGLATGGGGPYSFNWISPSGQAAGNLDSLWVDSAGTYQLIIADLENACADTTQVTVQENRIPPQVNAGPDTLLSCSVSLISLVGTGSSASGNLDWAWLDETGSLLDNDSVLMVSAPGLYLLVGADPDNHCSAVDTVVVFPDLDAPDAQGMALGTLNCLNDSVLLDASASSAVSGFFEVVWVKNNDTLSTEVSFWAMEAGNYSLIVTDSLNGCSAQTNVFVPADTLPPIADAGPDRELNCLIDSLSLSGLNSQGDSLNFRWLDINENLLGAELSLALESPGIYILEVLQQSNGCVDRDTVLVNLDTLPPFANPQVSGILSCQDSLVTLSAGNVSPHWIYSWLDSSGTILAENQSLQTALPGEYILQLVDTSNFCLFTTSTMVGQDTAPPVALVQGGDSLNCQVDQLILDGSASQPAGQLEFQWFDSGSLALGNTDSQLISEGGWYFLEVSRQDNGCSDIDSFFIVQDTLRPFVQIAPPDTFFCNTSQLVLDAGGSDTGAGFQSFWTTLPAGDTLGSGLIQTVDAAGGFVFSIFNTNNQCFSRDTAEVVEDLSDIPQFSVESSPALLTCSRPEVQLAVIPAPGQGPLTVEWQLSAAGAMGMGDTLTVILPGTYLAIGEDPGTACRDTIEINILQNIQAPQIQIAEPDTLSCEITSVLLDASGSQPQGNIEFNWYTSSGFLISETAEAFASSEGLYQLVVIDTLNGCADTAEVNVASIGQPPLAEAGQNDTLNCEVSSVFLSADGSSEGQHVYLWTNADGMVGEGNPLEVSQGGWYYLVVEDTLSACTAVDSVFIYSDTLAPSILLSPAGPYLLNCQVDQLSLDASGSQPLGDLVFEWQSENGMPLGMDASLNVTTAGAYRLIAQNPANACRDSLEIDVLEDVELPEVIFEEPDTLTCSRTAVLLDGSASLPDTGLAYFWQGPGLAAPADSSVTQAQAPGAYLLTLTDTGNFCQVTDTLWVYQDTLAPQALIEAPGNIDCQDSTVALDAGGSSTGPDFSYFWQSPNGLILEGEESLNPLVLAGFDYSLLVTNTRTGCTAESTVAVASAAEPPRASLTLESPTCPGFRDGFIRIDSIWAGLPPYLVSINEGAFVPGIQGYFNLTAGEYGIVIEDARGCVWEQSVQLEDPEGISLELGADLEINLGESVEIEAQTGRPLSEISLVNWQVPPEKTCRDTISAECLIVVDTPLQNTIYKLEVEDVQGCRAVDQVLVRVRRDLPVFVPNSFSPNGDGQNDWFTLFAGPEILQVNRLAIFDRWGEQLFERRNFPPGIFDLGWDGTFSGKELPPGVYVYWVELERIDGEVVILKGDLTLIR